MIAQHDITGDGMLNFEEFKAIFFGGRDTISIPDETEEPESPAPALSAQTTLR